MCDHERLKTIGDRVFCCICKTELPLEFLINQGKPAEPDPPAPEQEPGTADQVPEPEPADQGETPEPGVNVEEPAETEPEPVEPVPDDQNQAENQADGKKPGKSPGRKRTAKNAEKGGN